MACHSGILDLGSMCASNHMDGMSDKPLNCLVWLPPGMGAHVTELPCLDDPVPKTVSGSSNIPPMCNVIMKHDYSCSTLFHNYVSDPLLFTFSELKANIAHTGILPPTRGTYVNHIIGTCLPSTLTLIIYGQIVQPHNYYRKSVTMSYNFMKTPPHAFPPPKRIRLPFCARNTQPGKKYPLVPRTGHPGRRSNAVA